MPLLVLCGLPDSGRSRRADELRRALEAEGRPVTVVRDADALGAGGPAAPGEAYADPTREKALRAALKASVERGLGRRAVVLLDSLNYIKGFRYELYCLARAARTPLCLLYCLKPRPPGPEDSGALGVPTGPAAAAGAPGPDPGFPRELLDALAQRFEAPDPRNRWDRPLFTVVGLEEPLPLAQIRAALFESRVPAPHQATQAQPLSSATFLHQLDQVTSRVLAALMEAQRAAVPGDLLALPGTTERLLFTRPLSLAELSRLRRQFISYTKMHPNKENLPQLANMFLQYLGQNLR